MKRFLISTYLLLGLSVATGGAWAESGPRDPVFTMPVSVEDSLLKQHPFIQHSEQLDVVRSSFKQEKTIKALSRPLVSSGQLIFSKEYGAYWKTLKPFTNTVVITHDRITQTTPSGKVETFQSSRHPMLKAMTDVFTAMLAMDPNELAKHFNVFASPVETSWKIGLIPLDADMKKLIHAVLLEGQAHELQTLTLFEQYGDRTAFAFSYDKNRHAKLTAEERAWFGAR